MEQMGNSYLFFEIKRENIKVPLGEEARMVLQVKKSMLLTKQSNY